MMKQEEKSRRFKSPDVSDMYGIRTYLPLTEFYFSTKKKRDEFLKYINKKYELIEPLNKDHGKSEKTSGTT